MSFELPPLPNFSVQVPDFTAKALEGAQLKNMLSEMSLRQALAPSQISQAQSQAQTAQMQAEIQKMQLQGQQALQKWLSEGDTNEEIDPGTFALNSKIATFVGIPPDDPILQVVRSMAQHGVPAPMLMAEAQGMLQRRTEYNKGTEEAQKIVADNYSVWKDALAPIFNAKPEEQSPMVAAALPRLVQATHLSPELDAAVNMLRQNPQAAVPMVYNMVAAQDKALGLSKAASEAVTAAATAQENLNKLPGPGGALSVENQQIVARDTAIARAKQPLELAKIRAEEAIKDGDPAAAAQLLVNGDVAPSQLISSRKPAFAQQAFTAAKQLNPNWNSQAAEGYFTTAKSPTNVQFFGSAKSLTDQGGTLDQLETAYKNLPNGRIPALNKLSDWTAAASGGGSTAGFAQTALGVADDYAKVMGGGQGSDTSRKEVLDSFARSSSPQQMAAAIAAARQAVDSQMSSRIGQNPVMKSMYGQGLLVHVKDPQGGDHVFRTQQQADAFKKAAGIQ